MSALHTGSVTAAQDVLSQLVSQLNNLNLPPLGPVYSGLSGSELADALVTYRFTKKFAAPSEADAGRRTSSIANMLAYDRAGPSRAPLLRDIPLGIRRTLLTARAWLAETLGTYKTSNVCRFPSGESHATTHGWVDVAAKLSSDIAWEVSLPCVEPAAGICYNNVQLKRLVKRRFRMLFPHDRRPLEWFHEARTSGRKPGFYVFTRMFLACCDIVGTSRVTTVEKDALVDRVITCEPFWNMVVQLSIAQDLRNCLKSVRGIVLETAQDLHRSLIAHDSIATIDFSNASNSNWLCWLRSLWPPKVLDKILRARTGIFEISDADGNIEYHPVNMLAPMGCGYTFEVMTLTLFAISRALDSGSRVFGDDVIIASARACEFIDVMSFLGWQINTKKTFLEGNFRESCGGFYSLNDRRHIVCYDLTWPKYIGDVFISIQKIERILRAKQVSNQLFRILSESYIRLLHSIPRDAIAGPSEHFEDMFCPTVLAPYLRKEERATVFRECLLQFQWSYTSLISTYSYRQQSRPVKDHESFCSTVASFYSMRAHNAITSRKKETKLVRTTVVEGTRTPLTAVPWFTMVT